MHSSQRTLLLQQAEDVGKVTVEAQKRRFKYGLIASGGTPMVTYELRWKTV
jgi:hypothetical protein